MSCVGKHQSPEAKEGRNYLDQSGQPEQSLHGQWKRSPPDATPGTAETSPEDADQQETEKTAQCEPVERTTSEAEELKSEQPEEEQPDEEHQEQQHEEVRAASSCTHAQCGPVCHSSNCWICRLKAMYFTMHGSVICLN